MFLGLAGAVAALAAPVRIGVMAFRPKPQTLAQWQPLADVLTRAMPEREFQILPLTYPEMDAAVAGRTVDFLLTNPGHYVLIKSRAGISSPLATLAVNESGTRTSQFGGVVLVPAGSPLASLADLRGRRIAFPDQESLGGYQMQAYELSRLGIHLPKDATLVPAGMPHDNVVAAVLAGRADAGFVRTGTLEGMVREGKLDPARVRVLEPKGPGVYPVAVSTRLYPEWPFFALPGVDEQVARHVAAALFLLREDDPATLAMRIRGFGIPADYTPVENVLRELRMPPFEAPPRFTLRDVLARYRWQLGGLALALSLVGLLGLSLHLANSRLLASRELIAKAFSTSSDAINVTRLEDGVYLAVNEGFTRLTGYAKEDVLGRSSVAAGRALWVDLGARRKLAAILRETGEVANFEATFRKKDGCLMTGLVSAKVLEHNGERSLISITRDISELRKAEAERRGLEGQLQQAQKMESLGVLAGGIAHDMNNVLAAILGLACANLEAQPAGSLAHQSFATIVKAAERGGEMVKGLLRFSRQSPTEQADLDLNGILQDTARLLERTTLSKVALTLDLAADLRPVRGEAGALANAFMNLCVNAVDALPAGGALRLATRNLDPDQVEVVVQDNGAGMPRAVLERALDPFFTTKAQGKGTGLGLALVYSTVKAHKGALELASEPGQGTTVTLRFPACAPAFQARAAEPGPRLLPMARTILVVDDDSLVRDSVLALLGALGHRASAVASGEEALRRLQEGPAPDLLILDMNMPGLGGAGTLPPLRVLCPHLPVLLATGRADQTALDLVAAHPRVALLPKPFNLDVLQAQMEALAREPGLVLAEA